MMLVDPKANLPVSFPVLSSPASAQNRRVDVAQQVPIRTTDAKMMDTDAASNQSLGGADEWNSKFSFCHKTHIQIEKKRFLFVFEGRFSGQAEIRNVLPRKRSFLD